MHSFFVRANLIFFYALSAVFVLSALCSLTSLHSINQSINPSIEITNHRVLNIGTVTRPLKGDAALLSFDAQIDVSSLWNWNVKQIYLWIAIDYPSNKRVNNEIVIWDQILHSVNESVIVSKNLRAEYQLVDPHRELLGKSVNVTVGWDIMPLVGLIQSGGGLKKNSYELQLPATRK